VFAEMVRAKVDGATGAKASQTVLDATARRTADNTFIFSFVCGASKDYL